MNDKLTLKMERGRLVLELPQAAMDLEVDGKLQATYFLGVSAGPEDLREELRKATAAKTACKMMAETMRQITAARKERLRLEWVNAFVDGLTGLHRVLNNVHFAPEHVKGADANEGWSLGYAIRAAVGISETGVDPRTIQPWPEIRSPG